MERLIDYPLGPPDHVIEAEAKDMLKKLKQEIAEEGFDEQLLDESEVMSLAKDHLMNQGSVKGDDDNHVSFIWTEKDDT